MNDGMKAIKTALISVYQKEPARKLISMLHAAGIELIASGGTHSFIKSLSIDATKIENITSYPSILGGRVKTLHPKIFGGILSDKGNKKHIDDLKKYDIPPIDLVVVDLYPFESTLNETNDEKEIIEKIDIGGISLIRAAAKNFNSVLVVPNVEGYDSFMDIFEKQKGSFSDQDRKKFACLAFEESARYDKAISGYFKSTQTDNDTSYRKKLRYGENPHQEAYFEGDITKLFHQHHGKELSYNNLLDLDAAIGLINEFDEPTVAIIKHTNPCGLSSRKNLKDAWEGALEGDPKSAFGGIIIANDIIEMQTASEINKIFFEVIIAPDYEEKALEILKSKKNRIILTSKKAILPKQQSRSVLNGTLMQEKDLKKELESDLKVVTIKAPNKEEQEDLLFANKIVKHTKSNAIVLTKNKQLIGSGTGQTSRVDATQHAIHKAKDFGFEMEGAVLASDAFFPFPDSIEIASKEGISSIIQPGGSIRDKDSIHFCNENKISMVFTGYRHFKH